MSNNVLDLQRLPELDVFGTLTDADLVVDGCSLCTHTCKVTSD
ncbi:MAG TPA: hypothetical protein VF615_16595 [Longimicrobiaceae bacterium]|jgi:hypothetical protein